MELKRIDMATDWDIRDAIWVATRGEIREVMKNATYKYTFQAIWDATLGATDEAATGVIWDALNEVCDG